jgi:hypothetical protein
VSKGRRARGTLYDIRLQEMQLVVQGYGDILVESIRRVYQKAALELEEYQIIHPLLSWTDSTA